MRPFSVIAQRPCGESSRNDSACSMDFRSAVSHQRVLGYALEGVQGPRASTGSTHSDLDHDAVMDEGSAPVRFCRLSPEAPLSSEGGKAAQDVQSDDDAAVSPKIFNPRFQLFRRHRFIRFLVVT